MVLQYILKVLVLQPRFCLQFSTQVDDGGLDVVVQELDPLLHLPARLHHSVELDVFPVNALETDNKRVVSGRWVVVPNKHRLGRLLLQHQGVDGLEHLPDVRLCGQDVHRGVSVHRDHLLVRDEVEPRTVGSFRIEETLVINIDNHPKVFGSNKNKMNDTKSFIKTCIASPNCWNMSSTSSSSMETEVLVKAFTTFGS